MGRRGGVLVVRGAPPRRYPTRTCVVCRTARQKRELLRVVRTPDGQVVIDPTGRMAGRGAYVCNTEECRQGAVDKGSLQRALEVPIPVGLRAELTGEATKILRAGIEGGQGGQE